MVGHGHSTDLLPDGVVNGLNRWLVDCKVCADEARLARDLGDSRAMVGEFGGGPIGTDTDTHDSLLTAARQGA
jgi:hypothetical protein